MFQQLQRNNWEDYRNRKLDSYTNLLKKGEIDEDLIPLLNKINSLEDYVTLSSCSGRIAVVDLDDFGKKLNSEFLGKWHSSVSFEKVVSAIMKSKRQTWFIQSPPIIHVACKDWNSAKKLLEISNNAGFRRSGLISLENLVVEIASFERIELPVALAGKMVVSEDYLRILVDFANRKLERGKEKLRRLYEMVIKIGAQKNPEL
jgi:tRNA wybutosine-synthesizing protein 3